MYTVPDRCARRERGAALIIVLAFIVLLTGLVVAYFSRATSDRTVAQSSVHQTKVDQVAASGMDVIIGELRQEIANGSTPTTVNGVTIYTPTSAANMLPVTFGNPNPPGIPNLVRRSISGDTSAIPAPGFPSLASAVNSKTDISANGRSITLPRWNKHYLVPKLNTGPGDNSTDPVASFVAPDWVILTRGERTPPDAIPYPIVFSTWDSALKDPTPTNDLYAVGRFAYAIYDEGQLLDANVVGYPSGSTAAQAGRKGPVAYADLTVLPSPILNPDGSGIYQSDMLVGWRNYGTTQPTSNFPGSTFAANLQTAGTSTTSPAYLYWQSILNRAAGFTTTSGAVAANGRTDQIFSSRQQLIAYRATTQFSSNALQYLTTFSRELNAPSWKPATPTAINPDLLNVRVTVPFTRFDGSSAAAGDLLIKERFPLSRLTWITYKGPSATLLGKDLDPTLKSPPTSDPIILALVANGVSVSTIRAGTATNIKTCFGLVWDQRTPITSTVGAQWVYTSPSSANLGGTFSGKSGSAATVVKTLTTTVQSEAREPDFFELLKGGVLNGSLGVGSGPGDTFVTHEGRYYDTTNGLSADNQIIQIGANIIDQADLDSIPTLISFATNAYATAGIENLPYLNKLVFKPYWTQVGSKYHFEAWLLPSLWNPHQNAPSASQNIQIAMTAGQLSAATLNPAVTVTTPVTGSTSEFMTENANLWGTVAPGNPSVNNPSAPTSTPSPKAADITKSPDGYWGFHVSSVSASDPTTAPGGTTTAWPTFPTACDFQLLVDVTGGGKWKPYQTWKGCNQPASGALKCPAPASWVNNATLQDPEFVTLDPRTLRFGVWANVGNQTTPAGTTYTPVLKTLDLSGLPPSTGVYETITALYPTNATNNFVSSPNLYLYANNADATVRYKDLDAIPRQGDLLTPSSYTTAMQPANYLDRPQILNRPFQSLAELGQVFRDQPWKTLDFTTAGSPDVGLLDVFTLHDSANEAGKTSLNTRYKFMLTAILSNAIKCLVGTCVNPVITTAQRDAIVTALFKITWPPGLDWPPAPAGPPVPIIRKTDLLADIANDPSVTTTLGGNKEARELVMRAFSDATQTRTWNLLIDVVAQSGRYPPNASTLPGFLVEGEQHYWVHVAIDRFTGQVVDKQIEVVNE